MSNILDYLKWRGDLTLQQSSFNSIDSLIMARCAYLRWELIFEDEETLSLREAYEKFCSLDLEGVHMLADEDPKLFLLLSNSQRFSNCRVSDFINEISQKDDLQFCAMTIHLDEMTHYIAFRGTDNTLVGWKEDLNMSFQDRVLAQKKGLEYLKKMSKKYRGKFFLGGHSKGGNIAVYSTLFAPKTLQRRIISCDNFDGPGLSLKLYEKRKDHENYQKVQNFYPQASVIGRFLYQKEMDQFLIQSTKKGINQHDLYSWQIMGKEFICVMNFDKRSEFIDSILTDFIEKVPPQQRKECVDVIFDLLSSTNEETFHDLSTNWLKNSALIVKSLSKVDVQDRKVILDSMKTLLNALFDEFRSDSRDNEA